MKERLKMGFDANSISNMINLASTLFSKTDKAEGTDGENNKTETWLKLAGAVVDAFSQYNAERKSQSNGFSSTNPNLNWNSYDDDGFANRYNRVTTDLKLLTAYKNAWEAMGEDSQKLYGSFNNFVIQQCSCVKYGAKTTTNNTYSTYLASTNNTNNNNAPRRTWTGVYTPTSNNTQST